MGIKCETHPWGSPRGPARTETSGASGWREVGNGRDGRWWSEVSARARVSASANGVYAMVVLQGKRASVRDSDCKICARDQTICKTLAPTDRMARVRPRVEPTNQR